MPSTYRVTDTETGEAHPEHPTTYVAAVRLADYLLTTTRHMHVVKADEAPTLVLA